MLPNVEAFDIGAKLGLDEIDNGSMILKEKVVPRRSMLMRYVQVSADGTVAGLDNTSAIKYSYGSMLNLRVELSFLFAIDFNILPPTWLHSMLKQTGVQNQPEHRRFITDKLCIGLGTMMSNR